MRRLLGHFRAGVKYHSGPMPEPKIARLDYESYWRDRGVHEPVAPPIDDPYDRPRFEAIASLIPDDASVIDLGAGDGSLLAFLRERGRTKLIGVDISSEAVESLRIHGYKAIQADLATVDFDDLPSFEVAVLSETLEHLTEFEAILDASVGHADLVVISHPNIGYWPHRLRLLRGRFPVQWGWHPGEHLRYLTIRDLFDLFSRNGYEVVGWRGVVGAPSPWLMRRWPNLFAGHVVVALRGQISRSPT